MRNQHSTPPFSGRCPPMPVSFLTTEESLWCARASVWCWVRTDSLSQCQYSTLWIAASLAWPCCPRGVSYPLGSLVRSASPPPCTLHLRVLDRLRRAPNSYRRQTTPRAFPVVSLVQTRHGSDKQRCDSVNDWATAQHNSTSAPRLGKSRGPD